MGTALAGVPVQRRNSGEHLFVFVVDRETGLLTNKFDSSSMFGTGERHRSQTEYITERFNDDIYSTSSGEAVEELF
ncbi:hypothetical protein O9992_07590 [Vibrio lentus]|nr:hypothetical protein [Vibrio lentus]